LAHHRCRFHIDLAVQAIGEWRRSRPCRRRHAEQPVLLRWLVRPDLINQGNHTFVDETSSRIAPGDEVGIPGSRRVWGSAGGVPVIDFNGDGFRLPWNTRATKASQPLIWMNDGGGHFDVESGIS
jgi:hypothetical protein